MNIEANAVYLKMKTETRDFYYFSHVEDAGYVPHVEVLCQQNSCQIVISSQFKLKTIREKQCNRLDVYMSPTSAAALGESLSSNFGSSEPRPFSGNPNSTWSGHTQVPDIVDSYWVFCRGLVANAGGRSVYYLDSDAQTRLFADLEGPRDAYRRMRDAEVHLGIRLEERGRGNKVVHGPAFSEAYLDDLYTKATAQDIRDAREAGLDSRLLGFATGCIMVEIFADEASRLASSLIKLAKLAEDAPNHR